MNKKVLIILVVIAIICGLILFIYFLLIKVPTEKIFTETAKSNYCESSVECVVSPKYRPGSACCYSCKREGINKQEEDRRRKFESENCFKNKNYLEVCGDIDCEAITQVGAQCINNKCSLAGKQNCPGPEVELEGMLKIVSNKYAIVGIESSSISVDGNKIPDHREYWISFDEVNDINWSIIARNNLGKKVKLVATISEFTCQPGAQCPIGIKDYLCNVLSVKPI